MASSASHAVLKNFQKNHLDSDPPGEYGGSMDLRVLTQGTTLYLPVFKKGGIVHHCMMAKNEVKNAKSKN